MRRKGHFFRILLTAVLLLGLLPLNIWAAEGQSAGEATVLFTHDLHSCFFQRVQEGGEERGGFARLAAALTEERTGHPDALTVDAGGLLLRLPGPDPVHHPRPGAGYPGGHGL